MRLWHILRRRTRSLFFRTRQESDLREELQLHLERETDRLHASGLSRDAARLIKTGTANKGMVAKLHACRGALRRGVGDVLIANGREIRFDTLAAARPVLAGLTQVLR